jgi:hypothetical protein
MSYFLLFTMGLFSWLLISRKLRAKREADVRNWSVDFRNDTAIRPVTRRLPWKDL